MPATSEQLRELAIVAHRMPGARLSMSFANGRGFDVAAAADALLDPCAFRRAVVRHLAGNPTAAWVGRLQGGRFAPPCCIDLGAGLYAGRPDDRRGDDAPCFAFTSTLGPTVLEQAIAALPAWPVTVRVAPDPQLRLSLVGVDPGTALGADEAVDLARDLQGVVLLAELEHSLRAA